MKGFDVPTLVTGIILTGFGLITGWVASGSVVLEPIKMVFATVLLGAGVIGLIISLSVRNTDRP